MVPQVFRNRSCVISAAALYLIQLLLLVSSFEDGSLVIATQTTSQLSTSIADSNNVAELGKKDIDYLSGEEEHDGPHSHHANESEHPLPSHVEASESRWSEVRSEVSSEPTPVTVPTTTIKSGTNAGVISNMSDIVKLVRFVFLRGHIVLDASHRVLVKNESRIDRLMDYLHDIQLRRGKHRILPMEDRDLACEEIPDSKLHIKKLCHASTFDCLSASELMQMLPSSIAFHQAITRICPLLLFRQSRPICVADAKKLLDVHISKKIQLVEPSIERVWGFGVLFVTISILVSMGGLILLPFLKKSSRTTILTFFEGLAVGGLSGSAILHLFPQAFDIVDEKYRTYFWNTFTIFLGLYLFYCIELIIKIMKTYYSKTKRKRVPSATLFTVEDFHLDTVYRSSSPNEHDYRTESESEIESEAESEHGRKISLHVFDDDEPRRRVRENRETRLMQQQVTTMVATTVASSGPNGPKGALINSTREQLVQCLSTVNVMPPAPPTFLGPRQPTPPVRRPSKERMVRSVALRRLDHETANTIIIDTVAWMIVLGDALLNFIDGLSIGAAFDRNILAGMSISVAVMLEEVTHRLGTFAVLIRAGMSMKQSFFYIFLSGCACYPGLALGIFLGDEAEDASPYIFALSGGFFLYMALVDVMKAMTRTMENASRRNLRTLLHILLLQNAGIVLAAISLALLAFYEREMDFEVQELAEIRKNSFV